MKEMKAKRLNFDLAQTEQTTVDVSLFYFDFNYIMSIGFVKFNSFVPWIMQI